MQVGGHVGTGGMINNAADAGIEEPVRTVPDARLARHELAAAIRTIVPNGIKSLNHGMSHFWAVS
jgi:hypothetical protein